MISSPRRLTQGINIQYADIQLEIKFLDLPRDRAPAQHQRPWRPPLLPSSLSLSVSGLCRGSSRNVGRLPRVRLSITPSASPGRGPGLSRGPGSDQPSQESVLIPALCYNSRGERKEGPKTSWVFKDFWSDKPLSPVTLVLILFSCCS